MKTISVGELRQNPTRALDEIERGETYVITRHRREVGRIIPPVHDRAVSAEELLDVLRATPLNTDWVDEITDARSDFDDPRDPWQR